MRLLSKPEAIERLHAHRRELLRSDSECVMCALVARGDGLRPIAESPEGVVLLDRFGSRRGHLLVVSRRHIERATALELAEYLALQRLIYRASQALEQYLQPKRIYVAALGASSELPMSYPHHHIHLVPLHEDDARSRPAAVFSWSEGVIEYEPGEAAELIAELRAAWASLGDANA